MIPPGKAQHLSLVNCTTKTIHTHFSNFHNFEKMVSFRGRRYTVLSICFRLLYQKLPQHQFLSNKASLWENLKAFKASSVQSSFSNILFIFHCPTYDPSDRDAHLPCIFSSIKKICFFQFSSSVDFRIPPVEKLCCLV